jgi:hypothetical protein
MPWNPRRFGTHLAPVHKSHLNTLAGDYGCPRRFKYEQDAAHDAPPGSHEQRSQARANVVCGAAAHETIARALTNPEVSPRVLAGPNAVSVERVTHTLEHQILLAAEGREIDWGGSDPGDEVAEYAAMVHGLLNTMHRHVEAVVMVEGGFTLELEGVVLAGHVDLIYRTHSGGLGITDWKTSESKPYQIELDHGWELGVYSAALRRGTFVPREAVTIAPALGGWVGRCGSFEVMRSSRWQAERDALEAQLGAIAAGGVHTQMMCFGEFPAAIHHVHLRDFTPYKKAGSKKVTRDEDLAFYGMTQPGYRKFTAGDVRGPGWLPARRTERDMPRLAHRIRSVVGTVRMGRFLDLVGEGCRRCSFAGPCLTDGYQQRGEALDAIEAELREAGL